MAEPAGSPPPALPRNAALFLDFDGTLAEIAPTPDAVSLAADVEALLGRLAAGLGGAVAIVTGRPLAEIDRLLRPLRLPGAGLHGVELRIGRDVSTRAPGDPDRVRAARLVLEAFRAAHSGILLEDKGVGLAVHYRARPDLADATRAAVDRAAEAGGGAFEVLEGKMVVELKAAGVDKGQAIGTIMADPPFAGRVPVFAGDDVTDEAGFRAVLRLGGFGVLVGDRTGTAASHRVAGVPDLLDWLRSSAAGLDGSARTS